MTAAERAALIETMRVLSLLARKAMPHQAHELDAMRAALAALH